MISKMIDNTLLKQEATPEQVRKICRESVAQGFASVCANPCHTKLMAEELRGTGVSVCTVIGFPLGASATPVKAFETRQAVQDGAEELDMVLNVGMLKSGADEYVLNDVRAVVEAAEGRVVKVILECCLLTDEEKKRACLLCKQAGATFVKTSTGFSTGGATEADVRLMRETVGPEMGVKAAGGIRDYETAKKMIEAGATRLGTSAGAKIVAGYNK